MNRVSHILLFLSFYATLGIAAGVILTVYAIFVPAIGSAVKVSLKVFSSSITSDK